MWRRSCFRIFTSIMLVISCGLGKSALSATSVHVGASSYSVSGQSALILSAEMESKGPVADDGLRHPAKTKWDLQWRFQQKESNVGCAIDSIGISLGITHTKPIWRDKNQASQLLLERWTLFENALTQIQEYHVDLALQAATEIEARALKVTPQKSCEELEVMIGAIVHNVKEKYRKLKADYEISTNYGRRAGLSLM
jgi:predicted secreted Zn-dependent protease